MNYLFYFFIFLLIFIEPNFSLVSFQILIGHLIEIKKRTDHEQHKKMIIERKIAYVDEFMKKGLVKKATELVESSINYLYNFFIIKSC